MTSLREYAGYQAVAADLVGSCGRGTTSESVDAALLPNFTRAMPAQTIWSQ
ncbi:hypothetical protein [Escherichia coli]|uniref:hypothetical protein n=1 Tax=Escherichia coli TaxID=562 RepID=UPI0002C9520D|nr:hypothetical protein EC180200_5080 [Escherichia coli 180200]